MPARRSRVVLTSGQSSVRSDKGRSWPGRDTTLAFEPAKTTGNDVASSLSALSPTGVLEFSSTLSPRHFGPNAAVLRALNCSGNKSHSFHTIVHGRKVQVFRQRPTVYFGLDRTRGFEVDVRKRLDKRFWMPRRQTSESLRGIAEVTVTSPKDS